MVRALTAAAMIFLLAIGLSWAAEEGSKDAAAGTATEAVAAADQNPEMVKAFNAAVDLLEQKKYDEGRAALDKVLAMNPSSSLALKLRNQAKMQAIMAAFMEGPPETMGSIKRFFSLAERGRREWLRDQTRIGELAAALSAASEPAQVWTAIAELKTAGQHAVPQIVEAIRKSKPESHTNLDMALLAGGTTVVPPLCEALNVKDDLVKQEIIFVLGQIKDTRALPALAAIAGGDYLPSVKENAEDAVKRIAGPENLKSATEYCLTQAQDYYRKKYDVRQSPYDDFIIWSWDDKNQILAGRIVPEYAFYLEMTEKLCYQALGLNPAFESAYPLLLCSYFQQLNTYDSMLEAAGKGALPDLSQEDLAGLKARRERVAAILSTATALGKQHFYGALALALSEGNYSTAVACEGVLRQLGSATDLPVIVTGKDDRNMPVVAAQADPLVKALESENKQVRYNAAVSLSTMATRRFPGYEKVVYTLCEALGERGARVALVADPDLQVTNQLKSDLAEDGYIVDVAADADSALNAAYSVPVKDALIVDCTFKKAIDRFLVDYRSGKLPIILLCTQENLNDAKASYEGKVTGFAFKPVEVAALKSQIDAAFKAGKDTSGKALALDMNYMAAKALANIDPSSTVLPLGEALDALVKALALPDEVKLEALKALGNIAADGPQQDLIAVAADAANQPAVRLAALDALTAIAIKHGTVVPGVRDVAEKLLADADPAVREAAARLLGAAAYSTEPVKQLLADPKWVNDLALNTGVQPPEPKAEEAAPAPKAEPTEATTTEEVVQPPKVEAPKTAPKTEAKPKTSEPKR